MAIFYDTHAHLDYPEYASELRATLERAEAAGITKVISIGTNLESSRRAIQLAETHPSLYAAVGWHPSEANSAPEDLRPQFRELACHPKVVAIGEIGFDYYRMPSQEGKPLQEDAIYRQNQERIFEQQLEVASELGLNVVVHQRNSLEDTLVKMENWRGKVRGVFHCFSEDAAALSRVLALDCLVSFTGILTFKNGQNVRAALASVPFGKFMLETDSPYLAPIPYRGKRCEPAYVREIAEQAATVKGCSLEELSSATCDTAHEFFRGLANGRT